jgi:predicted helicase
MSNKRKAKVFHFDLYGKREEKYDFLNQQSIESIQWAELEVKEPSFFFVKKDFASIDAYNCGFSLNNLFPNNNSGLTTEFDELAIHFTRAKSEEILNDLRNLTSEEILKKNNYKTSQIKKISNARIDILKNTSKIYPISYRPFDNLFCIYTGNSNGIMGRPRNSTMQHFIKGNNLGLVFKRGFDEINSAPVFITNALFDRRGWTRPGMQGAESIAPLYLYPNNEKQQTIGLITNRIPNLNLTIVNEIAEILALTFTSEKVQIENTFAPIDILDYIYAVLHNPTYREKYKEFLKIDFPRVPYPKDPETFWNLVALGRELRQIHLLESPTVNQFITTYPITGNNIITKPRFEPTQSEPTQLTNSPTRELISSSARYRLDQR